MNAPPLLSRTFKHLVSRIRRLGFNPPPEADPDSEQRYSADEEGSGREDTPTVLTKLQKWVRAKGTCEDLPAGWLVPGPEGRLECAWDTPCGAE